VSRLNGRTFVELTCQCAGCGVTYYVERKKVDVSRFCCTNCKGAQQIADRVSRLAAFAAATTVVAIIDP
jgi:hypothetical protein